MAPEAEPWGSPQGSDSSVGSNSGADRAPAPLNLNKRDSELEEDALDEEDEVNRATPNSTGSAESTGSSPDKQGKSVPMLIRPSAMQPGSSRRKAAAPQWVNPEWQLNKLPGTDGASAFADAPLNGSLPRAPSSSQTVVGAPPTIQAATNQNVQ